MLEVYNEIPSPYTTSFLKKSTKKCDFFNKVIRKLNILDYKQLGGLKLPILELSGLIHEGFEAG